MTREDQSEVAADRTVADGWRSGLGHTLGNVDFQSAASVISQDVFRTGGVRTFRLAAVPATLVPFAFGSRAGGVAIGNAVSLALAVASSMFCPPAFRHDRAGAPGSAA